MFTINNYILFVLLDIINLISASSLFISGTSLYDMTQVKPIELAAVGRVAKLGELYDARSDQFLHLSLIKSNLPQTASDSTQNRQTKLKYSLINTLEEKFRTLDISAELKLSIMGGLFDLEGSGKFFKDTKRSAKSAKASLMSSFSTEYQQMSITSTEVSNLINLDVLEQIDATHVVVGIQWGGNVFISVEDSNYNDQDQQTIEGNLNAQLQMLAVQISGVAQVKIDEKQRNELAKFSFEIYGDILPDVLPQNIVDAIIFMKSAPKMLLDGNKGKGKAMKYSLIPITLIRQIFKIQAKLNIISNKIDEATVNSCTRLFDDMNIGEQKFNDLLGELNKYEKYIESKRINEVRDLYQNYKIFQSEVVGNLSEHLILARSGNETLDKLRNVLTQAYKHPYSFINIGFDKFTELEREFKFLKLLLDLKATILDKKTSFQDYLSLNYNKDIYTFFYKDEFPNLNEKAMMNFRNILEKRQTFGPSALFTAIKAEVLGEKEKKVYFNFTGSTKLSMFRNGQRLIEDYEINSKIPPNDHPELWSFYYMQTLVAGQQTQITQLNNLLNSFRANPVPIGFMYIEISGLPHPKTLWPTTEWENMTPNYAGQFFRAEGGGSSPFGQIQEQQTRSLLAQSVHFGQVAGRDFVHGPLQISENFQLPIYTGSNKGGDYWGIQMKHNNAVTYPRNQAIRIWRRIK